MAVTTAVSWGRVDVLRMLLEAKADVSDDAELDVLPLMVAATHGHTNVAKLLVEHGANVNAVTADGMNVLMVAWKWNHPEVVYFLVKSGANVQSEADWLLLARFTNVAAKIAEGIAARQKLRLSDENAGRGRPYCGRGEFG